MINHVKGSRTIRVAVVPGTPLWVANVCRSVWKWKILLSRCMCQRIKEAHCNARASMTDFSCLSLSVVYSSWYYEQLRFCMADKRSSSSSWRWPCNYITELSVLLLPDQPDTSRTLPGGAADRDIIAFHRLVDVTGGSTALPYPDNGCARTT